MPAPRVRILGLLASSLALLILLQLPGSSSASTTTSQNLAQDYVWTAWDADQYAVAATHQSIWIGTASGILQLNKTTGATRRYTAIDGIPHRSVYAVAIDQAGNVWFGGDAGLSRLDPTGTWSHYNSDNSLLPYDYVDGIALGAGGILWLSHGLPDGEITQWQNGAIQTFPDRSAAVVQAYAYIKQTVNATDLWAVSGDEVWVGYNVYDGVGWEDRRPPQSFAFHEVVRADTSGKVYVLDQSYDNPIYAWDGDDWSTYSLNYGFSGSISALTVAPDSSVWVGWQVQDTPYSGPGTGVSRLPDSPGPIETDHHLGDLGPVSALLATDDGLWGIGSGWIMRPQFSAFFLDDAPRAPVQDVILTSDNTLFVYSGDRLQTLDDQGTTPLQDDVWGFSTAIPGATIERIPGGGLWAMGSEPSRAGPDFINRRYHNGVWFDYHFPAFVADTYVQTARDTWFAYASPYTDTRGVMHLDDGGTPGDFSDDIFTDYPVSWQGYNEAVAVDSLGRLWLADDTGLYRYGNGGWQLVYSDPSATYFVCDLVPAADGTLFAQRADFCNSAYYAGMPPLLVIRPNGERQLASPATLVQQEFSRVSTAAHRNHLWTNAPDGAIWYVDYPDVRLARYDGSQETTFDLPFDPNALEAQALAVDGNNHVWLKDYTRLWRLSPRFGYQVANQFWLLSPGDSRQQTISVLTFGGYIGNVTLQLVDLPLGLTSSFETNPVPAGQATQLTLTAEPTLPFGVYDATLVVSDGGDSHTVPVTIMVVASVHDAYAPFAAVP